MRIDDVTLTLFRWEGIPATRYGAHTGTFAGESRLGLLTLRTDDGAEGNAFLGSALFPADHDAAGLMRALKPLVMGRDPRDREALYHAMLRRGRVTTLRAVGAVDVALWDLAARSAGQPLYKLIGAYREAIPAYASSAVLDSPEAYVEEALAFREAGWAAYKIHPPGPWTEDIALCRAVRAAVGGAFPLMLDATWSYSYEQAIRVGRAIEALDFAWYEDPLAEDDLTGCIKLREKLDIPLMATEYAPGGFTAYAPWILNRATDYLRGDVAVKGGITALLKTAHLAEAFGMNLEIHHGGNSLANWANLHVALAIRNTQFFEVLLPAGAQKYAVVDDLEPDAAGLIHAPAAPGLGATIDRDLIRARTIETLR